MYLYVPVQASKVDIVIALVRRLQATHFYSVQNGETTIYYLENVTCAPQHLIDATMTIFRLHIIWAGKFVLFMYAVPMLVCSHNVLQKTIKSKLDNNN